MRRRHGFRARPRSRQLGERMPHLLALLHIGLGHPAGQVTHPHEKACPLGNTYGTASIQDVEQVRALEDIVVGRHDQPRLQGPLRLGFAQVEHAPDAVHVGDLKVVGAMLHLAAQVDVAIGQLIPPLDIGNGAHALEHHDDPLQPVSDLHGDGIEIQAACLLEIGVLADLLAVEPDLPAQPPGAQGGGFPVVLHKADVVLRYIDAQRRQALQVELLRIARVGLEDDLVLVELLPAVGVLAISPIGRPHRRLGVGHVPWLGPQDAQRCGGVERSRAHLHIVRLPHDAAMVGPELVEPHDHRLKVHASPCLGVVSVT